MTVLQNLYSKVISRSLTRLSCKATEPHGTVLVFEEWSCEWIKGLQISQDYKDKVEELVVLAQVLKCQSVPEKMASEQHVISNNLALLLNVCGRHGKHAFGKSKLLFAMLITNEDNSYW